VFCNSQEGLESYQTKTPTYIPFKDLDPTISITFLIKDEAEFNQLIAYIESWKDRYSDDYIIGIRDDPLMMSVQDFKEDDGFELL